MSMISKYSNSYKRKFFSHSITVLFTILHITLKDKEKKIQAELLI